MSDTPYFGIWNKSAAKIGNPIAYIPAHYPTPDHEDYENVLSPSAIAGSGIADTSKLGAFAYCIEATESLSQVTTFFLQQRVDFRNRQEVGSWLTRFKELDLGLVHWKMFLPQKWKDSNISPDTSRIDMDPNLTLAHLTHNTSMILLHQHIACPPPEWADFVKLPSSCSAETCVMAAVETVSIAQKYLKYRQVGVVNSQFALCAFVAGRILLVHWRLYNTKLSSEFVKIVECLKDMSRRWRGICQSSFASHWQQNNASESLDLAASYSLKLELMHEKLSENPHFYMEILGYSTTETDLNMDGLLPSLHITPPVTISSFNSNGQECPPVVPRTNHPQENTSLGSDTPRTSSTTGVIRFPASNPCYMTSSHESTAQALDANTGASVTTAGQWQPSTNLHEMTPRSLDSASRVNHSRNSLDHGVDSVEDELTTMSNILLGQQFMEMDRVITLDGTEFAIDLDNWQNIR